MSGHQMLLVCAAIAAAFVVPATMLHALGQHLSQAQMDHQNGVLIDPRMQFQAFMAVLSCIPVIGMLWAAIRWARDSRTLARLTCRSVKGEAGYQRFRVLPVGMPVFFTMGIIRSQVYASTGARAVMSPGAFHAALLHEEAHVRRHDVVARLLLHLCRGGYGWVPGVREALAGLALRIECRADDDAIAAGASRKALFDAITGVARAQTPAASLSGDGVTYRLERLARVRTEEDTVATNELRLVVAGTYAVPLLAHVGLLVFCGVPLF